MDRIKTTISVDVNETFDAEVTLRFNDILRFFESCSNEQKLQLRSELRLGNFATNGKTIIDSMKWDMLKDAFDKYSIDELEIKLK